jgi:RimJ/RimL family protein N-acetyltransferase
MSIRIAADHRRGELGYWIGKPFWGNGYAKEAGRRVVAYGFEELELNKIEAAAFFTNPASWHVMRKIGMQQEGIKRQHIIKWAIPEDVVFYGIRRSDYCRQ